MKYKLLLLLFLSLLIISCSDEDDDTGSSEEFIGTYYAIDDSTYITNVGLTTDSVILVIYNNSSYSMITYDINSSDSKQFCSSNGSISGFGSNSVTFYPNDPTGSNCDQIRIPRGTFEADFVNYGDTILLNKIGAIDSLPKSIYRFKLLK